jgi:hypothetical protein
VEGRTGINLTHGLKKGNMYVAITSRNLHFCPMSGVKRDVVVTVPLSEIDNVELKGHPGKQFFYSHIWGTHKANKFAKRLKLTRKKKTDFVPEGGDVSPAHRRPPCPSQRRPSASRSAGGVNPGRSWSPRRRPPRSVDRKSQETSTFGRRWTI